MTLKGQTRDPNMLISKKPAFRDSVLYDYQQEMAYEVSNGHMLFTCMCNVWQ